ncbi:hypothetical protein HOLleu_30174 [Holothuria leucospilota]|uniref:CCHC-type domain-containing protein n=1 Tax=Holothuria leucospilota TaxID=206669 RepID=A0A9Q1GWH4_HOLLE|nr:hypothetical protein HOLleu_30174 [Holothuria leucospilota]
MAARRDSVSGFAERVLAADIKALERQAEVSQANLHRLTNQYFRTPSEHGCSQNSRKRTGTGLSTDEFKCKKPVIMPDIYTGETKWNNYIAHFVACADLNAWSDSERLRFLEARLRGYAQDVYMGISAEEKSSFLSVVSALSEIFDPEALVTSRKAKLQSRVRSEGESLASMCSLICKEVLEVYPGFSTEAQDELALDCFVGALRDRDIRIAVRRGRPKTLSEALNLAIEFEAIDQSEGVLRARRYAHVVSPQVDSQNNSSQCIDRLEAQVNKLLEENARLTEMLNEAGGTHRSPPSGGYRPIQCWNCGQWGHIRRFCPFQAVPEQGN